MAFRFRTRLTIWVSLLVAATVLMLSAVLFTLASGFVFSRYWNQGRVVTILAARSVEHGLRLPARVLGTVGEQMVVSSLLTSELVAAAEAGGEDPEDISGRLRRVVESSKELRGYPLVSEFWVSDEDGEAYIHSMPDAFHFDAQEEQSSVFLDLLKPGARPIVQELRPRDKDGELYMYSGTGGVDKPRIVQVGVSGEILHSIQAEYQLEEVLESFLNDVDVVRIAVLDREGETLAAMGAPLNPGEALVDRDVREFCRAFLRNPQSENVNIKDLVDSEGNRFVGVVTRIPLPGGKDHVALFMQHRTEGMWELFDFTLRLVISVGLGMLIAGVLLSFWLGRRLSLPLGELTMAVQHFGRGDMSKRVRIKRAYKEVQTLANTFNTMADRIQMHTTEIEAVSVLRERLESEMRIGAEVQRSLLPDGPPKRDYVDVAGMSVQAREVGGDFFDYIERSGGELGIAIGDATDKGLPAALLSSQCASMFHVLAEGPESPSKVLDQTNRALWLKIASSGRFVTAFLAYLDCDKGGLRYSNAGHNPPLLVRAADRSVERLDQASGLPLGVLEKGPYEDGFVTLHSGDFLVLYSDGITEAMDPHRALYSEQRLMNLVGGLAKGSAEEIAAAILEDVSSHAEGADVHDDITLVVVRFFMPC